jgi:3D-(3,5/4)-trihydroxycyclohexane-1,2-dione acylhydrolase (decyclizing)
VENGGYASIGGLSESLGSLGFGTHHRRRGRDGQLSGEGFPIDFVANAASLGVRAVRARTVAELREALRAARSSAETTVIVIATDREVRVPGYESWWDVPPAEVSSSPRVDAARKAYEQARRKKRWHL